MRLVVVSPEKPVSSVKSWGLRAFDPVWLDVF
jgi:hypothetical protein